MFKNSVMSGGPFHTKITDSSATWFESEFRFFWFNLRGILCCFKDNIDTVSLTILDVRLSISLKIRKILYDMTTLGHCLWASKMVPIISMRNGVLLTWFVKTEWALSLLHCIYPCIV